MAEKPIRVLHVVTQMAYGGLETMLMNYDRHLDHQQVQFDFLEHRDAVTDYDREILEMGGKIYRLPRLNPFSPAYLKALDAFFAEHPEYRIVHVHLDCMSAIPLKYAKKNGVPVRIAHAHNSNEVKNYKFPLKLYFKRFIPKYATWFYACGEEAGKWIYGGRDFSVLNNAIDSRSFVFNESTRQMVRQTFKIEQNTLLVGHVGRISPQKNHTFLIDVFSELVKIHPDSKLLLVGQGDLEQTIRDKVNSLGLSERVIFAGIRSDVNVLMQAMDVFIFPRFLKDCRLSQLRPRQPVFRASFPIVFPGNARKRMAW